MLAASHGAQVCSGRLVRTADYIEIDVMLHACVCAVMEPPSQSPLTHACMHLSMCALACGAAYACSVYYVLICRSSSSSGNVMECDMK